MQPKSGIYKIANKVTGDFYIGSSITLSRRFNDHKSKLNKQKHPNNYLQNVFNKYGLDNLFFETIEYVQDITNLIKREQYYLDTLNPKYNISKTAGSNLGFVWSKESKKKLSKSMLGRKFTAETRKKISQANKGKKFSKEHKDNIAKSKAKLFKLKSPEGIIINGFNLRKFCRENNLPRIKIWLVLNNKIDSYGGYTNVPN